MLKDILTVTLSILAFLISIYGIYERRTVAQRQERVRLSEIIGDLGEVDSDQAEMIATGQLPNEFKAQALNARRELLGQQALVLLDLTKTSIASVELRTVAYALSQSGYVADSDRMWRSALEKAFGEGEAQRIFATRGYCEYLTLNGRIDEAREHYRDILQANPSTLGQDGLRYRAETATFWCVNEANVATKEHALQALSNADRFIDHLSPNAFPTIQIQSKVDELRAKLSAEGEAADDVVSEFTRADRDT